LQGALLSAEWSAGTVTGIVQLQLGVLGVLFWDGPRTPEQDLLWRLMQQATTAWQTPFEPLSLDYHPVEFVSVRLELRHDRADFPLFFEGVVPRGPISMPDPEGEDRPTASKQTTLTAGLTTWF